MNVTNDILKKAGLKATPVRSAVLEILFSINHAVDAHFIETHFESVDRITLYRTLKSFEEKGLIHKITDSNAVIKYASCKPSCLEHQHHQDKHIHFECDKCHHTFCIEETLIPSFNIPGKYKITGINVTMTGKCESCQ